jgi:diguanylate cyclase (GGDEF)-like protein/PAS domain S-box-containing protein
MDKKKEITLPVADPVLQAVPGALVVVDEKGRIVQTNAVAQMIFGYSGHALKGQPIEILVPERFRNRHRRQRAECLRNPENRTSCRLPLSALRSNGTEFAAEIRLSPLQTPQGTFVVAGIRDLRESSRDEALPGRAAAQPAREVAIPNTELLRKSAARQEHNADFTQTGAATSVADQAYRRLVENQPDLICRFLPDTTLTFVNKAYAVFFGCTAEELIGKRFIEFLPEKEREEAYTHLAASTPENPSGQYEHQTLRSDGTHRWHLWNDFAFFDHRGRICEFQSVGVDITERKQTEAALRASENQHRRLVESLPDIVYTYSPSDGASYWSPRVESVLGLLPSDLAENPNLWLDSIHPDDLPKVNEAIHLFRGESRPFALEYRIRDRSGRWHWFYDRSVGERIVGDKLVIEGVATDITERKQAEEALYQEKERAEVTLHCIGDAVITTDAHSRVDYLNPTAETMTGWTRDEATGKPVSAVFRIVDEKRREPVPDPVDRCLGEAKIVGFGNHAVLIGRHGREYAVEDSAAPIRSRDGTILGAVLVFHDVTEARQLARQMAHDAAHDSLTGLLNRRKFEERLERSLASAKDHGAHHVLCYLDLDQFKNINDLAGHAAGDELLRRMHEVLAGTFRERDTLARLGGDEFGLLLDNCPLTRAIAIAQSVKGAISGYRFGWRERVFRIGVSIGLVPVTGDSKSGTQLLSQADDACYAAKKLGRNRIHVYQDDEIEPA